MISLPVSFGATGLIVMFIWIIIGSLGFPGGTITIVAMSSLTSRISSLILVIVVSFAAAIIGDISAYELARKLSSRLRKKLVKFSFFEKNEPRARNMLSRHKFPIVFFTRFMFISLCSTVSYVSGFEKINRKKFYLAVFGGEFLFALIYSVIGYALGETFNTLISAINYAAIAIILFALLVYLIRYLARRKRRS